MNTANIKQQLHNYLEVADDKKLNAIYKMVENEIKEIIVDYPPEFKADLDTRINYLLGGGKMISPSEMNKKIQVLRKKRK